MVISHTAIIVGRRLGVINVCFLLKTFFYFFLSLLILELDE